MKKLDKFIILITILCLIAFMALGCAGESASVEAQSPERFVLTQGENVNGKSIEIYVDTKTNIEYAFIYDYRGQLYSVSGLTMLCEQDGTPLIH